MYLKSSSENTSSNKTLNMEAPPLRGSAPVSAALCTKTMKLNLGNFSIFLLVFSSPVLAEVSDKIILPKMMLIYAVLLSIAAIALLRKWPWWFPLISLVTIALSSGGLATVMDTYVGPAAIAEQGITYKFFAYLEVSVVVFANLIGFMWGFKMRIVKNA